MRAVASWLLLVGVAAWTSGCASNGRSPSAAQTDKAGDTSVCVMRSGGREVLRLNKALDVTCTSKDGMVQMKSRDGHIDIWAVGNEQTVDGAAARVAEVIKPEFEDFKSTSTVAMTVAGAPAKRLMGSGTEADDGDPGTADVVVFTLGGRVFVACTHGEGLSSAAQQWMLKVVEGAQVP